MNENELEKHIRACISAAHEKNKELLETVSTFHGKDTAFLVDQLATANYSLNKLCTLLSKTFAALTGAPDNNGQFATEVLYRNALNAMKNVAAYSLAAAAPATVRDDSERLEKWVTDVTRFAEQHFAVIMEMDRTASKCFEAYIRSLKDSE